MDVIDRIIEIQETNNKINFIDNLKLTRDQEVFLKLNTNNFATFYNLLKVRQCGRTYAMLLKAISKGLNEENACIGIFSKTFFSTQHSKIELIRILEENDLKDYIEKETNNELTLKNGSTFKFISYFYSDRIRGVNLNYAFIDDWNENAREASYVEDCILSTLLRKQDAQAFFMCAN